LTPVVIILGCLYILRWIYIEIKNRNNYMDYEKAYKEALERARGHYGVANNYGKTEEVQELEHIFPELAESEDERIRKWLITQLRTNYKGLEQANQAIAWLEKQKEQQPAEWSEEDERNIATIESIINGSYEDFDTVREDYPINAHSLKSWLKSLRPQPHWKPSEEQIEALQYALGEGGKFDKVALQDLYNQLKLM